MKCHPQFIARGKHSRLPVLTFFRFNAPVCTFNLQILLDNFRCLMLKIWPLAHKVYGDIDFHNFCYKKNTSAVKMTARMYVRYPPSYQILFFLSLYIMKLWISFNWKRTLPCYFIYPTNYLFNLLASIKITFDKHVQIKMKKMHDKACFWFGPSSVTNFPGSRCTIKHGIYCLKWIIQVYHVHTPQMPQSK